MPSKDLSEFHEQVADIFPSPKKAEEWDEYRLKPDQVKFYKENGFLPGIKMLDETQLEILREELFQLIDPARHNNSLFYEYNSNESTDPKTILFHALGEWRITNGLHDALWNPAFVMAASQLLDDKPVRFWHDQIFYKPAKKGGVVAWHQDYSYWTRTKPVAHITCWCALDDTTSENGCLQYIAGSHKWGLLPKPVIAGDLHGIRKFLSEDQQKQFDNAQLTPVKAGEAIFHHSLTLHGSGENKSSQPRRAFVINAFADGVVSDTDEPLLHGVPPVPKGNKMEGQFFPLLFTPLT
ncbi:MAG TPA: phytanoyl-CoA dioxygenase family protein [Segetibacter sp.]